MNIVMLLWNITICLVMLCVILACLKYIAIKILDFICEL